MGDDGPDLVGRRIRIDFVYDLDPVETVPDIGIGSEDTADVHATLDHRSDGPQLDVAQLRDGCDTGGEAACQAGEYDLDRCGAVVFRGENFRVIGLERERLLVLLLKPLLEPLLVLLLVLLVQ